MNSPKESGAEPGGRRAEQTTAAKVAAAAAGVNTHGEALLALLSEIACTASQN